MLLFWTDSFIFYIKQKGRDGPQKADGADGGTGI